MKTTLFGKLFLILPLLLIAAPFTLAFGFGLWYLFTKGWLLYWMLTALGILTVTKVYFKLIKNKKYEIFANKPQVNPSETWGSRDDEVFEEIKRFAKELDTSHVTLDKQLPNQLLDIGITTTTKVASHYYPESSNPALEVTLPHLLRISELILNDIRKEMIEKVPFSHSVTINHFLKVPKVVDLFSDANASYRLGRMVLNPIGSLISELKDRITSRLFNYSKEELLRWMIDFYILKVARYSIDLYGHNITLNEFELQESSSPQEHTANSVAPLKILVVGEVNSGKSSLINALFGKDKAIVDNIALESGIQYYQYNQNGQAKTILVDTQGYQNIDAKDKNYHAIINEIKNSDLIILMLSATNAARATDKELLNGIESYFQAHPKLRPPTIIGALNQIDKLAPQKQWSPPFNIQTPQTLKEQNIKQAIEVIQQELKLETVVPINLHPKREYNIQEALIPTLLDALDDAKKTQYIRSLREYQSKEFWIKLKEQAKSTGRLMIGRR